MSTKLTAEVLALALRRHREISNILDDGDSTPLVFQSTDPSAPEGGRPMTKTEINKAIRYIERERLHREYEALKNERESSALRAEEERKARAAARQRQRAAEVRLSNASQAIRKMVSN